MPLLYIQEIVKDVFLGVWDNSEVCPDEIQCLPTLDVDYLQTFTNPLTKSQRYCARLLVQELSSLHSFEYKGITHSEYGAPQIDEEIKVSLSHTAFYTVATLSPFPMGIDIEQPSDSIFKIAPRLFSDHEIAMTSGTKESLGFMWCIKEAVYKLYQQRGLNFIQDIVVTRFDEEAMDFDAVLCKSTPVKGKLFRVDKHLAAYAYYV